MRRKAWWVVAVVLAAATVTGVWIVAGRIGNPDSAAASTGGYRSADGSITAVAAADRAAAPDLAGITLDGKPWRLTDDLGHVVVLNVWASWCAPCRAEAPVLRAAAEKFTGDGVRFMGLNTRDSVTAAKAFETAFDIPYPSVDDQDGALLLQFAGTLNPSAIPSTVVIDQQGRVAATVLGRVDAATLRCLIEPLLSETDPPAGRAFASP